MTDLVTARMREDRARSNRATDANLRRNLRAAKALAAGGGGRKSPRGAGASMGAGSWKSKGSSPPLLLKIGTSAAAASDKYQSEKDGSIPLFCNMLGLTAAERAREWVLDAAQLPTRRASRLSAHISISEAAGVGLSNNQWRRVAESYLKRLGSDGPCVVNLHTDSQHKHIHITFSLIRSDGSIIETSWNRYAWRQVLREVERDLGLQSVPSVPTDRQSNSDAAVNAARRSARRKTPPNHVAPSAVRAALARALDWDQFQRELSSAGIEARKSEKNGRTTGVLYRKIGAEEWLAGSSISRDVSLKAVERQLQLQLDQNQKQAHDLAQRKQADAAQQTTHYPRMRG